jgi:hypothetical protein
MDELMSITSQNNRSKSIRPSSARLPTSGSSKHNLLNQSPKIHSGKLRQIVNNDEVDKLFSILDVNLDKIARGLKLPGQYERREEAKQKNNLMKSQCDIPKTPKVEKNDFENTPVIKNITKRRVQTAKESNRIPQSSNTMGAFFPPNQANENFIIRSQIQIEKGSANHINGKEIKTKNISSDIFFAKQRDMEEIALKSPNTITYTDSDIFLIKDNAISKNKTSEKYTLDKNKKAYDNNTQSKSEWIDKNKYSNFAGHSSINYNILTPNTKSLTKTRTQVEIDAKNYNPSFRQKSLSEYMDLTRMGVANVNKEYQNALKNSNQAFFMKKNVCASYIDNHKAYKNLTDQPFANK